MLSTFRSNPGEGMPQLRRTVAKSWPVVNHLRKHLPSSGAKPSPLLLAPALIARLSKAHAERHDWLDRGGRADRTVKRGYGADS